MTRSRFPSLLLTIAIVASLAAAEYGMYDRPLSSNDYKPNVPAPGPVTMESVIDVAIIIDGSDMILPEYSPSTDGYRSMPTNEVAANPSGAASAPAQRAGTALPSLLSPPQAPLGSGTETTHGQMAAGNPIPIMPEAPAPAQPAEAAPPAPSPPKGAAAAAAYTPATDSPAPASAPSPAPQPEPQPQPQPEPQPQPQYQPQPQPQPQPQYQPQPQQQPDVPAPVYAAPTQYFDEMAPPRKYSNMKAPSPAYASEKAPEREVYRPAPAKTIKETYGAGPGPASVADAAPITFPRSDAGFQKKTSGDYVADKESPFQASNGYKIKLSPGNYTLSPGAYPTTSKFVSGTYQVPKGAGKDRKSSSAARSRSAVPAGFALLLTLLCLATL